MTVIMNLKIASGQLGENKMETNVTALDQQKQRAAVVIYHRDCNDGFTAAWVFHRWYEHLYKHTEYIAANYGDALPSAELTM